MVVIASFCSSLLHSELILLFIKVNIQVFDLVLFFVPWVFLMMTLTDSWK